MIPLFKVFMAEDAPARVAEVLRSGYVGQGPRVDEFEAAFGKVVGAEVIAVNSGTSAIHLALTLCGVGPGDEVITTPMTCAATNLPILHHRARPVWADVDPQSGLIDPSDVRCKLTSRTKAIIAVDWGGTCCDYTALQSLGVPVIQDAAHCFDPVFRGDFTCWSFQAIKFLTTGDGGALSCPDAEKLDRARLLRWFGLDRRSSADFRCSQDIREAGFKFQMNDIAAAIGLANLPHVAENVQRQCRNSTRLATSIGGDPWRVSERWLHTLLVPDRVAFVERLRQCGVAASPVHSRNDKHSVFAPYQSHLPGVDSFSSQNVAVPCGWWLSADDLKTVGKAVEDCL